MLRSLVVLHRYLGVALGGLMTLWCLSGFVMMYQSFPALEPAERLAGLEPLPAGCCDLSKIGLSDDLELAEARIEMAAGALVLRVTPKEAPAAIFDVASGAAKAGFGEAEVLAVARTYGARAGIAGNPRDLGVIEKDQWTVQLARRNAPVHQIAFDDAARTDIYVSGASGEVFLDTDRRERVLSWLGAIPHWLYPSILREHPRTWSQVVIWTSTLGVFLTATGLYVGIVAVGRLGRVSPFKGLWVWHHMTGLFTMGPWGLFESEAGSVRPKLAGTMTWGAFKAAAAAPDLGGATAVQIAAAPLGGAPRVVAVDGAGKVRRLGANGRAAALAEPEVQAAIAGAGLQLATLDLMTGEDSYYYAHHDPVALPVWRAVLADAQKTRLYIDADSGRLLRAVDRPARAGRWWESGLHTFDFPVIRKRPVWDLVVLPLLAGVTLVCALGAWLGIERIGKDWGAFRARRRRARDRRPARGAP